jgi:hypothetical protein
MTGRDMWLLTALALFIVGTIWHTNGNSDAAGLFYLLGFISLLDAALSEWRQR